MSLRILILDDNPADAEIIRSLLEEAPFPFEIVCCLNVEDAQEVLASGGVDCLLLDHILGPITGLSVVKDIRAAGDDLPIISMTGWGNERVAVEAIKEGAQDYLVKGVMTSGALERAIRNAVQQVALERRVTEKQQELECFVSVVAHDLQQPLCALLGNVEVVRDFCIDKLDPDAKGFITTAVRNAKRMSGMIESLLEYSRLGRSGVALGPVDLNVVMDSVLSNLDRVITESEATINTGSLPMVLGEETALVELLQNLIANATKFRCDKPPRVNVACERENERWRLSVQDNGIGIDPKHQNEIFAPFKRLHSRTEFEGSGIGLATCKKIVEQHGGNIWMESEPGRGTTFHFTLQSAYTDSNVGSPTEGDERKVGVRRELTKGLNAPLGALSS